MAAAAETSSVGISDQDVAPERVGFHQLCDSMCSQRCSARLTDYSQHEVRLKEASVCAKLITLSGL